jgi:hypothetical protein
MHADPFKFTTATARIRIVGPYWLTAAAIAACSAHEVSR